MMTHTITPFAGQLQSFLMEGAKIVACHIGDYQETVCIKLDTPYIDKNDGRQFIYLMFHSRLTDTNRQWWHARSFVKLHINEIKRRVSEAHYEDEFHYMAKAKKATA